MFNRFYFNHNYKVDFGQPVIAVLPLTAVPENAILLSDFLSWEVLSLLSLMVVSTVLITKLLYKFSEVVTRPTDEIVEAALETHAQATHVLQDQAVQTMLTLSGGNNTLPPKDPWNWFWVFDYSPYLNLCYLLVFMCGFYKLLTVVEAYLILLRCKFAEGSIAYFVINSLVLLLG